MNWWNRRLCSNIISALSVIAVSAATIARSAAISAFVALRAAIAATPPSSTSRAAYSS